ncbi:WD40-repeat-containing domain protein [Rhodocollybia butyracea]|uniref:WD repeat-containing protein JIP5 n=1 Tax=Rhodocollybia butyracea TaxID=206335 RepID=A0A9P5P3X4_9AGAR|nr:WD40-repeat-containing domain protein [Rhodocollybia butyracea]
MPDVPVGSQIFDLAFHPSNSTDAAKKCLNSEYLKKSCRGIALSEDGEKLYTVGKGKGLHTIDTITGKLVESRAKAHETAINRVKNVTSWLLSTGDDDGVIKLWDPRKKESVRKYTHHFDYITDFLWLDDKKHLVATSGDGTLSVIDVRAKVPEPFAQSEDQEDELLSMVPIKGTSKIIVGTQLGILSVFNRSSGWNDCVDRIPGHPHSVDALCALPASLSNVDHTSTILTGSSDGFVRAVSVFPTTLHGVVADHGQWPVERIAVGEGMSQLTLDDDEDESIESTSKLGHPISTKSDTEDDEREGLSSQHWVGSAGHDELLKLTNLGLFFSDKDDGPEQAVDDREDNGDDAGVSSADEGSSSFVPPQASEDLVEQGSDSDVEPEVSRPRKRKKKEKDPLALKRQKGRNEVEVEGVFFADL